MLRQSSQSRHRLTLHLSCAYSTFPRPFNLHFGVSFAGKPPDAEILRARRAGRFSDSSPVGQFRDSILRRPRAVQSNDAGQDFLYIQEVLTPSVRL